MTNRKDQLNNKFLSDSEQAMRRGHVHQTIPDKAVASTEERVRKTGALERLRAWRDEDTAPNRSGGRTTLISDRAILTGMLLLAKAGVPIFISRLATLFQYELSNESRELLGLESPRTSFIGHLGEQSRWYANTHRAFHRMNNLMEPFPQDLRHSKTYTEIQDILHTHDTVLADIRKARLDEFTKLFLVMTYNEQPRIVREVSNTIDISFDQTFIGTPTTKGYSRRHLAKRVADEANVQEKRTLRRGPVDAFAGWHLHSDQTDTTGPPTMNYAWGWEANIAVRVDSEAPGQTRFPALAIAATLSLPNVGVAEEAVSLMRAAKATGLEPDVADADLQYWANSPVERLHDPAFKEGFTPSTDYRTDRLGVQGGDHGALYIEGGVYCPGIPEPLRDATKDFQKGLIDKETYRVRIKARKAFQLRQKGKPDGRTVLRCPALGPSPSVTCPLRELYKTRAGTDKERPAVGPEDVPEFLEKICRQHSISFEEASFRRQKQAFDYGTKEWDEFHTSARNSIESLIAQLKAGGAEDIESAGRRRIRGFGAAQVIVTILLTNYNLRTIAAFVGNQLEEGAGQNLGEPTVATGLLT